MTRNHPCPGPSILLPPGASTEVTRAIRSLAPENGAPAPPSRHAPRPVRRASKQSASIQRYVVARCVRNDGSRSEVGVYTICAPWGGRGVRTEPGQLCRRGAEPSRKPSGSALKEQASSGLLPAALSPKACWPQETPPLTLRIERSPRFTGSTRWSTASARMSSRLFGSVHSRLAMPAGAGTWYMVASAEREGTTQGGGFLSCAARAFALR